MMLSSITNFTLFFVTKAWAIERQKFCNNGEYRPIKFMSLNPPDCQEPQLVLYPFSEGETRKDVDK